MKRILFLFFLILPSYLFAQNDTLPTHTWSLKDKREPALACLLALYIPGAGQVYNKEYEKALGVVTVMVYSGVMLNQAFETSNDQMAFVSIVGMLGTYTYSVVDAVLSSKRINNAIALQLGNNSTLSLKPDFRLSRNPLAFGGSGYEPVLGLRLKLSL